MLQTSIHDLRCTHSSRLGCALRNKNTNWITSEVTRSPLNSKKDGPQTLQWRLTIKILLSLASKGPWPEAQRYTAVIDILLFQKMKS